MKRVERALLAVTGLAAVVGALRQTANLVLTFAQRAPFPMDLEWMEGAHLYHAYRLLHGLPLYGDPARGFATFPYPPGYWLVLAVLGAIGRLDYVTARWLNVGLLTAVAAVVSVTVARRAPSRAIAIAFLVLPFGAIAAAYPAVGGGYDLVRGDTLALFFPVVAAALLGAGRVGKARAIAIGALLTFGIFTKQTDVFFAMALLGFAWRVDRRVASWIAGVIAAMSLVAAGALTAVTHGWFVVWLFDQGRQGFRPHADWSPALGAFLVHAPFLLFLPWLVPHLAREGRLRASTEKWLAVLAAAFVASVLPFSKLGGWLNVLIPFFVLSWPVSLLVVCDAFNNRDPGVQTRVLAAVFAVTSLVLFALSFDRSPFEPTPERRVAADRLLALVRSLDGRVVVTASPFIGIREGKGDEQPILQGFLDATRARIAVDYADALDRSGADWLIVTRLSELDCRDGLRAKFEFVRDVEFPVQFMPDQPVSLWHRRPPP